MCRNHTCSVGSHRTLSTVSVGSHTNEARSRILWEHTSPEGPELERYEGSSRVDVAVVGAGIAGLSTALHLVKGGASVTVLEAEVPGGGATGRSGGLLAPDLIRHTPEEVEQLLGRERGARLVNMIGASARGFFELIGRHRIVCDAEQSGFWTPAHNAAVAGNLQVRARQWQARGFRVQYFGAKETAEKLGTGRYCGALAFADGGAVNPLAFSRGLAFAAIGSGAEIYARSPVREVHRSRTGWRLATDHGVLEATNLVLAANGGNPGLHAGLRHTILPLDVIEYATEPLSEDQRSAVLRDDMAFTDKQPYIFTARLDAAGRLIAAFPDFSLRRHPASLSAEAITRIEQHFPLLNGIRISYLWPGRAWINPDLLPKIYTLGENSWAIQSCNGRGLALNTVLGQELAFAILTHDFSAISVRPEAPRSIRAYAMARHVPSVLMYLAYFRSRSSRWFRL